MVSDTLTEAEAETLNEKLVNVQTKAFVDTPAESLSEVHAKTLDDTHSNLEFVAQVVRQLVTHWAK